MESLAEVRRRRQDSFARGRTAVRVHGLMRRDFARDGATANDV